jgi:hypothetical protein
VARRVVKGRRQNKNAGRQVNTEERCARKGNEAKGIHALAAFRGWGNAFRMISMSSVSVQEVRYVARQVDPSFHIAMNSEAPDAQSYP